MGRKSPPTIPGPSISSSNSLPVDKYVAAMNIRYPYTTIKNRLPIHVVVQGRNPYVSSHEDEDEDDVAGDVVDDVMCRRRLFVVVVS